MEQRGHVCSKLTSTVFDTLLLSISTMISVHGGIVPHHKKVLTLICLLFSMPINLGRHTTRFFRYGIGKLVG